MFSNDKNQVGQAYRMSRQVKDIKKRLDGIAANHKKFELIIDNKPLSRRREETCSYVDANEIIGREDDKDKIIDMLLDPSAGENVSFLAIVGVGGLGKTALAQLVFNDEKIKHEYSQRRWVCVSDQDGEHFDVKSILCKILGEKLDATSVLESVQNHFQEKYRGKKFFLVLDDAWNEDREKWLPLKRLLLLGQEGNKVLVTIRSEITTTIIADGNDHVYMLQGLSKAGSWRLFELSAFTSRLREDNHYKLVEIGKKIVEKCYYNPLAIKVVGSLLFGQEISKWRSLENSGFVEIGNENGILPILKLSYYNLKPLFKSCFRYCAIFPKDFRIEKEKIIRLWMAQGYVVLLDGGQNLEDAAKEHFSLLLRRCFFQEVKRDEYGEIESVKIHDLMHDVAQAMGEEICVVTSIRKGMWDKIRHVYGNGCLENFSNKKKIRSLLLHYPDRLFVAEIINLMRLRVLDCGSCNFTLPHSIHKLLHLRYLDLSHNNDLKVLCESITELYNLQTLDLSWCGGLHELPKGISKLVNLSHLELEGCHQLTFMPAGMEKMSNLRVLPLFVEGCESITNEKRSSDAMLKDLKALCNIQGKIHIIIGENCRKVDGVNGNERGEYLNNMEYLRELHITFKSKDENNDCSEHEAVLDNLKPASGVKKMELKGYKGKRIGRVENYCAVSVSLLVHLRISNCENVKQMPTLSKLPHLKSLILIRLESIEYMEIEMSNCISDTVAATEFFPSLKTLEIYCLPMLQGWWKGDFLGMMRLTFPLLSKLKIKSCPNLISFAPGANLENITEHQLSCLDSLTITDCPNMNSNLVCPTLGWLKLKENSERLRVTNTILQDDFDKLIYAQIDKLSYLKSLSTSCLTRLYIRNIEVDSLLEVKETFKSFASSLEYLHIEECKNLKWLSGLEHLTALRVLKLEKNKGLDISEDDNEELWKSLSQSLGTLVLSHLPKMKTLPEGIKHLSSLRDLRIKFCSGIELLPVSIKDLTSLDRLFIYDCPHLNARCKKANGEDFPKIQHIPDISVDLQHIS